MEALLGGLLPLIVLGGLVFAIVSGFRSATADPDDPIDASEAAKSFALHVGLYVALIASIIGMIDVLQSLVEERDRLAGSSSDLARGLSLLIVAVPSGGLLLRSIGRRSLARTSTGKKPSRGWSVYLVAALTTTLVGTLISVAQIASDATDAVSSVQGTEVMQLVVWFGVWCAHWFALRPWLRVRGDAHLAIGTVVGLSWMLSGLGAVVYRLLADGYDSAFEDTLTSSIDIAFWLVIAVTGAAVWAWHWVATFNRPAPGSVVEGHRQASPLWFVTVVVAGTLPGLIAIVFTTTVMISGLLIWFIGTTDQDAADYFEPAPALVAAAFIAVVSWAYHRWELTRHGEAERNEAIRFHDYSAVAAGLVATVSAAASLVALAINVLVARSPFAGSSQTDNALIIILTVLVVGALVWWRYWNHIEKARQAQPIDESDSFWRKLYLITGFGIGGLVFAIALTWVVFAFLRDLLDGALSRQTVEDLSYPIGWALAVVGAVWYHFEVWGTDRAVLADRPPPPPAPVPPPPAPVGSVTTGPAPARFRTRPAELTDAGELYTLQLAELGTRLAAAAPDASLVDTAETLAQIRDRVATGDTTVVLDGHRIVGFVVAPSPTTGSGRAVTAPDCTEHERQSILSAAGQVPPSVPSAPTSAPTAATDEDNQE